LQTCGEKSNWIHDPFSVSSTEAPLPLNARQELVTLRVDRALKTKFVEIPLDTFWLSLKSEYPILSMTSVKMLVLFSTMYLCELALSALNDVKTYKRQRLWAIDEKCRLPFQQLLHESVNSAFIKSCSIINSVCLLIAN
jgi:hypothetical protein